MRKRKKRRRRRTKRRRRRSSRSSIRVFLIPTEWSTSVYYVCLTWFVRKNIVTDMDWFQQT